LKCFLINKLYALFPRRANYKFKMMSNYQINTDLSLYIPHVFPNFTQEYIASVFEYLDFGRVDHVDLVSKMDKLGNPYNSAYVHFTEWFAGPITANFQERVLDQNKEARIVHDDPWYWIVLENNAKKYVPGERKMTLNITNPTSDYEQEEQQEQEQQEQEQEQQEQEQQEQEQQEQEQEEYEQEQQEQEEYEQDEIDDLIYELYNAPMDISCEFADEELIKDENKYLKEQIQDLNEFIDNERMYASKDIDLLEGKIQCFTDYVAQIKLEAEIQRAENISLHKEILSLHEELHQRDLKIESIKTNIIKKIIGKSS